MSDRAQRSGSEVDESRRRFVAVTGAFCPALAALRPLLQRGKDAAVAASLGTEERIALALARFRGGFHCSQSVLEAYAADIGLDAELARRLAAALAGGSTVGGECGVVGSGYLVLGAKYAGMLPAYGDTALEERLWGRVRRFLAEFKARNGAITCRELLGVDAFSKEGREEALRRNLFATRCPKYIRDGIEILDSLAR